MIPKNLTKRLEKQKAKLAKCRDELRELLDEATSIEESNREAIEFIECAVDRLSEYL